MTTMMRRDNVLVNRRMRTDTATHRQFDRKLFYWMRTDALRATDSLTENYFSKQRTEHCCMEDDDENALK